MSTVVRAARIGAAIIKTAIRTLRAMRLAIVVPGGVDPSGRERVVPLLLWLVERLARRHDVHVFVLDYYPEPCSYELLGARVHDLGRVTGPIGFRRFRIEKRLLAALRERGPFD